MAFNLPGEVTAQNEVLALWAKVVEGHTGYSGAPDEKELKGMPLWRA